MRRPLAAIALLVAALTPAPGRAAETHRVFMSAPFRFCVQTPVCTENQDVTIARGDTVEWIFLDPACVGFHALGCTHTATSSDDDEPFDSGLMPGAPPTLGAPTPKLSYSYTFDTKGTFSYVCSVHVANQQMKARVIVG